MGFGSTMNVLIIGSGGREHALAWKIAQSPLVERVFCTPGNPGIESIEKVRCVNIGIYDFPQQRDFIVEERIGLTVVGPENPLAGGIVDFLEKEGHLVFGPSQAAAQLEASKSFAKEFMKRMKIPTAAYAEFTSAEAAIAYIREKGAPVVVKADGLAAGKGVTVAMSEEAAVEAVLASLERKVFGDAGTRVIIEEYLEGEEASILALCDGETVVPMLAAQDHKALYDGDKGPNTGGMGAYAPAPVVDDTVLGIVEDKILKPVVRGMASQGTPYKGVLYAGLMITKSGPKVIEFNCRFGDPETQVVLPLLDTDLVPVLLACCKGKLAEMHIPYKDEACVTVVMASGGYPGEYATGKAITGIELAERDPQVMVFHAGTKRDKSGLLSNGGRVLNVTATGGDLGAAIERAYQAVDQIHFEGAHARRDIGMKGVARLAEMTGARN